MGISLVTWSASGGDGYWQDEDERTYGSRTASVNQREIDLFEGCCNVLCRYKR